MQRPTGAICSCTVYSKLSGTDLLRPRYRCSSGLLHRMTAHPLIDAESAKVNFGTRGSEAPYAYDIFRHQRDGCIKVVLDAAA